MRVNPDIAACMYHTGLDPRTMKPVYVATAMRDRKMQRALLQFFKPENYFTVREALLQAGRGDLIGDECDSLIPAQPPKEAIEARRRRANVAARGPRGNEATQGDHYHAPANPARREGPVERGSKPAKGYRPGRPSAERRQRKRKGSGPKA